MQVKPRFSSYKFIEKHPIGVKDDTGNEFQLVLLEAKIPADKFGSEMPITPYQFWTVVGKKQQIWGNKAVSFYTEAFWDSKERKKKYKGVINGIEIEEYECGEHYVFCKAKMPTKPEDVGIKTSFKIKLEEKKEK